MIMEARVVKSERSRERERERGRERQQSGNERIRAESRSSRQQVLGFARLHLTYRRVAKWRHGYWRALSGAALGDTELVRPVAAAASPRLERDACEIGKC